MEDDIHFLVNEIEGELQKKIEGVIQEIDRPVQKKDTIVVKKFTRALVQATARRLYPPQKQQRVETADTFTQLKKLERYPYPHPQPINIQQPVYYTPVIPPSPAQTQKEQITQGQPPAEKPKDNFLPSGLPPKPPEAQPMQKLPTDETLTFKPDSLPSYKLPLPAEMQKEQVLQQSAPAPTMIAPAPLPTTAPPVAVTVPQGIEPPIALIVDAESKKPIVTVAIQNDMYMINEPALAPEEINMVTWLRKKFAGKEKKLSNKRKLSRKIWKSAKKMHFSMQKNDENEYLKMKYYLVKHVLQYGWIEPLLHDELITKIICEGENIPLIVIRKDKTFKTNITYPSADHINRFLSRFAERAYKKVTEKSPIFDFTANGYHIEGSLKTMTTSARFTLTKVV